MNDAQGSDLSARGRRRREAMLDQLVESMDTLHRRRRAQRRVGTVVGFSIALLALAVFGGPSIFRHESPQVADHQPDPPNMMGDPDAYGPPRRGRVEMVRTRPEIVAQYAPVVHRPLHIRRVSRRGAVTVEIIDDQKLLQMLAQMHRPTGLVRADGKVWLTAAVTDAELESGRPTGETGSQS